MSGRSMRQAMVLPGSIFPGASIARWATQPPIFGTKRKRSEEKKSGDSEDYAAANMEA